MAVEMESPPVTTELTGGRLLAGNAVWNLFGSCAPALVAIFCLPTLKRDLGADRLGVITLAWAVIGYFGLFDLGLSRALTKLVAEKLGQRRRDQLPALIWTSLVLMTFLGLVGALVAACLSRSLVERVIKIPGALQIETLHAFYVMSISIPIVILTAALRGVLEALQEFRVATAIRVPSGVFSYLGPLMVLPLSHSLVPILITLVVGRAIACAAHFWACTRVLPGLARARSFNPSFVGPLVHFGSWMTVSNIVGPLMMTFDRFVVGAMLSITAVAYYATPYEVVSKLLLVPAALIGVLFPAFATASSGDGDRLAFLFDCGVNYIFIAMFPVILILLVFAPEALGFWLGNDFARQSTPVVRWLAAAIFLNSLGNVPFAHLQSIGRADITAKLHVFELPVYIATLFLAVKFAGIQGAAIAWLVRVLIDTTLLFFFSRRALTQVGKGLRWPLLLATTLTVFAVATIPVRFGFKIAEVAVVCVSGAFVLWRWLLSPKEKTFFRSQVMRSRSRGVQIELQ